MCNVWWDVSWWLYCRFAAASEGGRILKIGAEAHTAKLWRERVHTGNFLTARPVFFEPPRIIAGSPDCSRRWFGAARVRPTMARGRVPGPSSSQQSYIVTARDDYTESRSGSRDRPHNAPTSHKKTCVPSTFSYTTTGNYISHAMWRYRL